MTYTSVGYRGTISLQGAAQLQKTLDELPRKVSKRIANKAMMAGSEVVLARAEQLVPVKTGFLRDSLIIRPGKRRRNMVRFIVGTLDDNYQGDTFYAAFVEFGHRIGKRKLRKRKKIGELARNKHRRGRAKGIYSVEDERAMVLPKKYLEPAFDQSKGAAVQAIIETTSAEILAYMQKQAGKTRRAARKQELIAKRRAKSVARARKLLSEHTQRFNAASN